MTLSGRIGSSLVLLAVVAATAGLFVYFNQLRQDTVATLQSRLQAMELQRLEEDKGRQVETTARQAAERFSVLLQTLQRRVEATADARPLQAPQSTAAQQRIKKEAFFRLAKAQPDWKQALLTDAEGAVLAATATDPPRSLSGTPAYQRAARQRVTDLRFIGDDPDQAVVQISAPCLSTGGSYLGVLQVVVPLPPDRLEEHLPAGNILAFVVDGQGRRLTPVGPEGFPKRIGELTGQSEEATEALLRDPKVGFFTGAWRDVQYLAGTAPLRADNQFLVTLLEVSGLQKLISRPTTETEPLRDPVVLGGLAAVVLVGLLLNLVVTGGSPARRLHRDLTATLRAEGETPEPIQGRYPRDVRPLVETINLLISQAAGKTPAAPSAGSADIETAERLNLELVEARQEREQYAMQNQELLERLDAATQENQQLRHQVEAEAVPHTGAVGAEEASQIRIDAIVNMSEDLKATLDVIKNYISSILASEEGKITDTQQEFLGVVINKSARLERQIGDLLDLSHLETESQKMYLVPTDLTAMLQDVVLNVQPQAETKQVNVMLDLDPALPQILLNGDRMGQVLLNMVQHAVRVTPLGGEVQVTVSQTADRILIKLVDGGQPLTPEQAAGAFKTFYRGDVPAPNGLMGAGLKFVIVRGIIEAHHGQVEIRGLSEQGNELVISLPKTVAGREEEEPSSQAFRPSAGERAEAPAAGAEETPYDLSAFMQGTGGEGPGPALPADEENLDDLLKDIDTMDNRFDR